MKTKAMLFEPGKKPQTVRINLMDTERLREKMGCFGVGYLVGFPDPKLFLVIGSGFEKPQKVCKALAGHMLVYGPVLVGYTDSPCNKQGVPSRVIDLPDDAIADLHKWIEDVPGFLASKVGDNF